MEPCRAPTCGASVPSPKFRSPAPSSRLAWPPSGRQPTTNRPDPPPDLSRAPSDRTPVDHTFKMTASALSKWPTCLACLRRLAQPFGTTAAGHSEPRARAVPVARPIVHIQTRAASHRMRLQDQGVVVRLLQDIPQFGRKRKDEIPLLDCAS